MDAYFWKIIKSIFGTNSEEVKRKLEDINSWDKQYFTQDIYLKVINYCLKTYETTGCFPTESVFRAEREFTSYGNKIDDSEIVDLDSLPQLVSLFEKTCFNRFASTKLNTLSQSVVKNGVTPELIEEIKKLQRAEEIKEEDYSEEEIYNKRIASRTGIKTGISELDGYINCLPKGAVMTIAGFTGAFKCVSEKTLIPTTKGLLTIKDIVDNYEIHNSNNDFKVLSESCMKRIYQLHKEGKKKSYKIYVNGREIETTPVHRFRISSYLERLETKNNQKYIKNYKFGVWVEARSLKIGDKVFIKQTKDKKIYKDNVIEFVDFKSRFSNYVEDYSSVLKKWCSLEHSEDFYSTKKIPVDVYDNTISNLNNLKEFIDSYSICKLNKDAQSAFLYAVFSSLGTLSYKGNIGINSNDYSMLNKLSVILLNRGVVSIIYKIRENYWRLVTENYYATKDLVRLAYLKHNDNDYNSIELLNVSNLEEEYDEQIEKKHSRFTNNAILSDEIVDNDLWEQEITDIVVSEEGCNMYDLSIEDDPTYIANGIVTHNTTTAANIVYRNVYNNGYNFCYISLEVSKLDLLMNLWSIHSLNSKFKNIDGFEPIPTKIIRNGLMTEKQKRFLFDVIVPDFNNNSKGKLIILDETDFKTFSFGEITSKLEEVDNAIGKKLDGVVLDHTNLCKFYSKNAGDNACEATNQYVSYFRRLSISFRHDIETGEWRQLAVILLAQTNRTGWHEAAKRKGAYDLTALAEANELERCSTIILTTFHDANLVTTNELLICLLKNRYGSVHEEPITVFLDKDHYYVGDAYEGASYEYHSGSVEMDKLVSYDITPSNYGLTDLSNDDDEIPF